MPDIIFAYQIPDTNWLNPVWRKFEVKRLRELEHVKNIEALKTVCPGISVKKLIKKTGISYFTYYSLKNKYYLSKRRK